jgi:hypothetical protein
LLRLRREGAPVEALAKGLRGLGVRISDESLRLWLNQELGHKPARRRKPRFRPTLVAAVAAAPATATLPVQTPTPVASEANAPAAVIPKGLLPADTPVEEGTPLILPGETARQARLALIRRTGLLIAKEAAAKAAKNEAAGPQVVRDNI